MYMNFVRSADGTFQPDTESYQERIRRDAVKAERRQRVGKLVERIIIGAIKWTAITALWAIVGGIVFFVVGGLSHYGLG